MKISIFIITMLYLSFTSCSYMNSKQKANSFMNNPDESSKHCLRVSTKKMFATPSIEQEFILNKCSIKPYNKTLIFFRNPQTNEVHDSRLLNAPPSQVQMVRQDCERRLLADPPHERCYTWYAVDNFIGKRTDVSIETPIVNITSEEGLKVIEDYKETLNLILNNS